MKENIPDATALDRAYADGRLVAFFRLATRQGCPFTAGQSDLRIAWLDGFAYGDWEAISGCSNPYQEPSAQMRRIETTWVGPVGSLEQDARSLANIAIAHLLRLSKHIKATHIRSPAIEATLEAADCFSALMSLSRPETIWPDASQSDEV